MNVPLPFGLPFFHSPTYVLPSGKTILTCSFFSQEVRKKERRRIEIRGIIRCLIGLLICQFRSTLRISQFGGNLQECGDFALSNFLICRMYLLTCVTEKSLKLRIKLTYLNGVYFGVLFSHKNYLKLNCIFSFNPFHNFPQKNLQSQAP